MRGWAALSHLLSRVAGSHEDCVEDSGWNLGVSLVKVYFLSIVLIEKDSLDLF